MNNSGPMRPVKRRWGTVPMAWKEIPAGRPARAGHGSRLVGRGLRVRQPLLHQPPLRRDPHRPAYPNILWGDGHVDSKTNADYPDPLSAKNYSLCHWFGADVNDYYWSPADSAPVSTHGHQMWE